ncbi:SDR family oxidoreductase [Oceanisphaera sp. KMM 10153]|uniref:SDR family oxidoreductase n=1 Tax=Oceanisphaera submarina TaxID=3390193 RepID=UPI0039767A4A
MKSVKEQKIIIIGGNSGIGKALAVSAEHLGYSVVTASRQTGLDMTDPDSLISFFEQYAPFDHLVITAGSAAPGGPFRDLALQALQQGVTTKLWGTLTAVKTALDFINPHGSITLTSGVVAHKAVAGTSPKTLINAALEGVLKPLALELAPLRLNMISPGLTDTAAYQHLAPEARASLFDNAAAKHPLGRIATAHDVAQGYLFAIENPSLTGASLHIDAGGKL